MTLLISDVARNRIQAMMEVQEGADLALRVAVVGRRFGRFVYDLAFVSEGELAVDDKVMQTEPFRVVVDAGSAAKLEGAKLDFIEHEQVAGFTIENPNPLWDDPTARAVQQVIDEEINPMLGAHGGVLSMVDYADGVVKVAFGGGCRGCGLVDVTLAEGVEARIREAVPEVTAVIDTTDHGVGGVCGNHPPPGSES